MSTTTWVDPFAVAISTAPSVPSLTVTRLGTISLVAKLRLEAFGFEVPFGYTVRNEAASLSTTVTFMTAAVAVEGMPFVPATGNARGTPAISLVFQPPVGPRESRARTGVMGW